MLLLFIEYKENIHTVSLITRVFKHAALQLEGRCIVVKVYIQKSPLSLWFEKDSNVTACQFRFFWKSGKYVFNLPCESTISQVGASTGVVFGELWNGATTKKWLDCCKISTIQLENRKFTDLVFESHLKFTISWLSFKNSRTTEN